MSKETVDFQEFFNVMSEASAKERSSYHLTLGDLIDALRAAPEDTHLDKRVVGIGSYRGYYIDIALYTEREGYSASDANEDFNGDYKPEYDEWSGRHSITASELPREPHKLADALEDLIGNYFTGYKGGEYEIIRDKPLWLAEDSGDCSDLAVMEISKDLELVTKQVED